MKRVGILGGTFDPPHTGHLTLALEALQELDLDQVVWIPAAVSP
ncbi:MAG: adenylyltransferase/cytidyltransferase family protein, partial [Bacteroidetes Order II. Incertae sedis bacterium]|nr:adenylyltransferase/cytidyltransferase family protein [Bacteroidetes Order II. bacterium]